MICHQLAQRLAPYLSWQPRNADRFFIGREEIAESEFIVSDMVVELIHNQGESNFHFNGTTEWALDSIESEVAVWLPTEEQLRQELADAFLSLDRVGDGFVVTVNGPNGAHHTPEMADAADAYALALLHLHGGDASVPTEPERRRVA